MYCKVPHPDVADCPNKVAKRDPKYTGNGLCGHKIHNQYPCNSPCHWNRHHKQQMSDDAAANRTPAGVTPLGKGDKGGKGNYGGKGGFGGKGKQGGGKGGKGKGKYGKIRAMLDEAEWWTDNNWWSADNDAGTVASAQSGQQDPWTWNDP